VGSYPFEGSKDLEIGVSLPETDDDLRRLAKAVEAFAMVLGIKVWKVGLEPLDDLETLILSNGGRGRLWPQ
jgi:hypothetical protein